MMSILGVTYPLSYLFLYCGWNTDTDIDSHAGAAIGSTSDKSTFTETERWIISTEITTFD
jgi:hypothetical protein